jgi:hypothetical protein
MVVFSYTPLARICSASAHKRGLLGKRRNSQQARKAFTFLFALPPLVRVCSPLPQRIRLEYRLVKKRQSAGFLGILLSDFKT